MTESKNNRKMNMWLNGEWAKHVRKFTKRLGSKLRRQNDKKIISYQIKHG